MALSMRGLKEGKRGGITANGAVSQWKKMGLIVQVNDPQNPHTRTLMLDDGRVIREEWFGRGTKWVDSECGLAYDCIYDACMEERARRIVYR